ncbi:MAG: TadE/TadG family type IV pilus assembly protein [Bryobacteraceae bacterium]
MIESAFTLIPTFALIFAFLDFGLMLYRWSSLQNAVREGVRYAITFQRQTSPSLGQTASIKAVVERNSMRLVRSSDSPQHIFVKFFTTAAPDVPVATGGNVPGNIVEVSVQNVSYSWIAPLSGSYGGSIPYFRNRNPLNLKVYAYSILGGYPVGQTSVPE